MVIARGGSSSPGLYISRTGAAGAPYSGQKRPGRPASLKGAEERNEGAVMSHIKTLEKAAHSRFLQAVHLAPDSTLAIRPSGSGLQLYVHIFHRPDVH